jgi:LacI family transcriptional regulator
VAKEVRGIHLIAELAQVSIGTVDRALHGRAGINEATRKRILQIARQVGYAPNLAARALSTAKANTKIGVCVPREIHFFYDQLWSGILEEARQAAHLGIRFVNRPIQALGEGDTDAFKKLVGSDVKGIILTAGNPKALRPLIDDAEQKGIPVVCVSTDAPESRRSCVVCVEPHSNGSLAGELMGKLVLPGSKVALIAGMLQAEDHRKKTDGFMETFPRYCTDGRIIKIIEGHEDEKETFQKTSELLRKVPDIAGIYVNTVNCLPVCRALSVAGLAGKTKLIATDLFAEMSSYLEQGTITASIYQQPHRQGQVAVRVMVDHLTSKVAFPPKVHFSPGVVMASNLHLFREMRASESKLEPPALKR